MAKLNMKDVMKKAKEVAKTFDMEGIPFMEGRSLATKEEMRDLFGVVVLIKDYGFINGDDGEYTVFIVDGEDELFYASGQVLTQDLHTLEGEIGTGEFKNAVREEGLEVIFGRKKSKNGREYTTVKLFPND